MKTTEDHVVEPRSKPYRAASFAGEPTYDLLCFVLYGAQNQTLPETPPLAAPRITVVGSYATGLTMKIQGLPAPKLTFVMFFSGWLFWAFAQHRSASASARSEERRVGKE